MILIVGHTKGGVGKTLLAVNVAAALARRGGDVLLIDGDEQASAATFAQIRAELALSSGAFTTVQLQGAAICQQVKALRAKHPEIVIDVGGRDIGSLRAALTVVDGRDRRAAHPRGYRGASFCRRRPQGVPQCFHRRFVRARATAAGLESGD